jgi:hypothetical protein
MGNPGRMGALATDREPFGWLGDPHGRRESLVVVHKAVRAGWLAGVGPELASRRRELANRMMALHDDPAVSERERRRVVRILMAMLACEQAERAGILRADRRAARGGRR